MLIRYVLADLLRNPRRTLATLSGVAFGIGLFCGVLFFVDGLSASMTQRAVAPLAIDVQRIVTERTGSSLTLSQTLNIDGRSATPVMMSAVERARVDLVITNTGVVAANEVTIRSVPSATLNFVEGSALADGVPIDDVADNPFAHGPGQTGHNLGTIEPGDVHTFSYVVEAAGAVALNDNAVTTSYSSRESVSPIPANQPPPMQLDELVGLISQIDGVERASSLSLADLGPATLSSGDSTAAGPTKIIGIDRNDAARDETIDIVEGELSADGAVLSAEATHELGVGIGDTVTIDLPDGSAMHLVVSGVADLSRSRALFSSRRGGDLETFVYVPNSVMVSSTTFADIAQPAYERASSERGARLKAPPIREVDIWLERTRLNSDPATALEQTQRVGIEISAVAAGQDYLLDNISNTLTVATADAAVAKRLFIFLGLPGGLLAAMLAAYAGSVLAEAERREHATLRVRGAGRRHLLQMLALHTALLTAVGAVVGIVLGYVAAASLLGRESLTRASTTSLVASGIIGAAAGFAAAGLALYVTGHRSIQRQINDDRAQLAQRAPFWRRAGLDVIVLAVVVTATIAAIRTSAFDGAAGSVYFGRAVQLDVMLLVLPLGVWLAGTLLAARLVVTVLTRIAPQSAGAMAPPLRNLYQRSIGRRPWPIGNGTIIIALVVALSTTLTAFTSSYDAAKTNDARYTLGADIRITPAPTAATPYALDRADLFAVDGIQHITPVIYGLSNVILSSARTSDPANLAAIDPATYPQVASSDAPEFTPATLLDTLVTDDHALLLSTDMASFLQADIGDRLDVLLARATDQQIAVRFRVTGLYERLPGFPDGADAVISIQQHTTDVPTKTPDFFLAMTTGSDAQLNQAVDALRRGPGAKGDIQIETRIDTLARDQSSLAALNIGGLVDLDNAFSLLIAATAASIFVFGLLLQRRREFITLRALGLAPNSLRRLIIAEASTVAITGIVAGLAIGTTMGLFFVTILRPLFVLPPPYVMPPRLLLAPILLVIAATIVSSITASLLLGRLQPTELLRDE